jgi:hypothetical protein
MQDNTNCDLKKPHIFWLYSPYYAVLTAVIILAINDRPGLDGAAHSTAIVFWFTPIILYFGYKSIVELHKTNFSKLKKIIFIILWFIPTLPIGLASLFGIALISEVGPGILLR